MILGAIAFASPLVINHFGGSYGWKALYSHTFKYVELAPGEFIPSFTMNDYMHAMRRGLFEILDSSASAYLALAVMGSLIVPELRVPLMLSLAAGAVHFVIYPNFEPRYYAILYVLVAIASAVGASRLITAKIPNLADLNPRLDP
jgi:hypothetical protein